MKVLLAIDAVKHPLTGIGRYTYELAAGLERRGLESLRFLQGARVSQSLASQVGEAQAGLAGTSALSASVKAGLRRVPGLAPLRTAIEQWRMSQAQQAYEDHIFHGPNYAIPAHIGPSVVTIHDLSVFKMPESHPADRVKKVRRQIEEAIKRASAVITDTQFTRQEVIDFFALPPARVHAVHLASSQDFYPRDVVDLAPALRALDLEPGGYTLFVGTVEPRKNLQLLLDAYARLPLAVRSRWPLVIAGSAGWRSGKLHEQIERARAEGWLKYLGYAPQEQLALVVAGARLFAFPSRYEGFGLPVLEAAGCGVPVICSNASCLPEVGGLAFAYHDPDDGDGLFALLDQGLTDTQWREEASKAGLHRARAFSWDRCVSETILVYKTVS